MELKIELNQSPINHQSITNQSPLSHLNISYTLYTHSLIVTHTHTLTELLTHSSRRSNKVSPDFSQSPKTQSPKQERSI